MNIYIFLTLVIIATVIYVGFVYYKNEIVAKRESEVSSAENRIKLFFYNFLQSSYVLLIYLPIIRINIKNIKTNMNMNNFYSEEELRRKSVVYFYISTISSVLVCIVLMCFYGIRIDNLVLIAFICVHLTLLIQDNLTRSDIRILTDLSEEVIEDIKHKYHHTGMVDEAIYEAYKIAPNSCRYSMKHMYGILKDEEKVVKFQNENVNKYYKLLVSLCFITRKYGDKKINNKYSLFVRNLNYIKDEIKLELYRKKLLKMALSSLLIVAIVPILFPQPIANWVKDTIPEIREFYEGAYGYYGKFFIMFICWITFVYIRKLIIDNRKKLKEYYWEEEVLKYTVTDKVVDITMPRVGTKRYKFINNVIRESGNYIKMKWLYLRKFVVTITFFVLILAMVFMGNNINVNRILKSKSYGVKEYNYLLMTNRINDKEEAQIQKMEKEVLQYYKEYENDDDIKKALNINAQKYNVSLDKYDFIEEKIKNKINAVNKQKLNWIKILAMVALAIILGYIPIVNLILEKNIRLENIHDEVLKFQTIILILMEHDRVTVQLILEWMEHFSDVLKNPIRKCLNSYSRNHVQALNELKNSCDNKNFHRLIDNLIAAEEKLSIKKSFESLESDREFDKLFRADENKLHVSKKIEGGRFVSLIPLYVLIIAYLAIPMLVMSITQFNEIFNSINL